MAGRVRSRAKRWIAWAALAALFALLCRAFPAFARTWTRAAIRPAAAGMASLSAKIPFPLLEALALAGAAAALLDAASLPIRCLRARGFAPAARFVRRLLAAAAALATACALLWYPAYFASETLPEAAEEGEMARLCETLIGRLNASPLEFPDGEAALREAERAAARFDGAAVPEGALKEARCPEWMGAIGAAGLYSPWTAEAIVDGRASPAARIFTGCHELMHLKGVAGEGAANVAAWTACRRAGGAAADSADLWALRYAMSALREADLAAWRACAGRMDARLREVFEGMNGFVPLAEEAPSALAKALGVGERASNYGALAVWLATAPEMGEA